MYDYKLLEAFTAVVENKGFERASLVLHLTQSAVSQRVRQLEEAVGQILLVRSNPPVPTDAGKNIISHFKKVELLEVELDNSLLHKEVSGFTTVSVSLNADSLCTWFLDAVEKAVKKNRILLKLYVDDQDETHRMMKDGEVSACISTRDKPFQSCSCSLIGTMSYKMFCSPEIYEKHFKNGFDINTLKEVPVIIYNEKDTLHKQMFTNAFKTQPSDFPYMHIPDVNKYKDAIANSFGIGMMTVMQCREFLDNGTLRDAFYPHTVQTPLYWHRWNITSLSLDALTNSILKKNMLI
ncbi:ArgP/LysG family DNA-binding transcriptional regulator [Deferribacteres bacterium DY0609]|nr:ArgP/LysG family DNA-binding transcriptional regulator [Denitrovibrio acetiphilus]